MMWSKAKKSIDSLEFEAKILGTNSNFVMLVDDNEIDSFISKHVLEIEGFANRIEIKDSGGAALEYLRLNQTEFENIPNLIFLNINTPTVDGFVFLYEFEKLSEMVKEKSKVIILSNSVSRADLSRIINSNSVIKYFTKPLNSVILSDLALLS